MPDILRDAWRASARYNVVCTTRSKTGVRRRIIATDKDFDTAQAIALEHNRKSYVAHAYRSMSRPTYTIELCNEDEAKAKYYALLAKQDEKDEAA